MGPTFKYFNFISVQKSGSQERFFSSRTNIERMPFIVLLILFMATSMLAQNNQVDSMKNLLIKAQEDSNKVILMNKLINEMTHSGNFNEMLDYSNQSIHLAEKLGYKKGLAQAYRLKGISLMNLGAHDDAISNQLLALKTSEKINDLNGVASANNNIGLIYKNELKYSKAIPYHKNAVELFKKVGNQDYLARTYTNVGDCYKAMSAFDTAMIFYDSSLAIATKLGNERGIGLVYEVKGNSYFDQKKYIDAIAHYEIAFAYSRKFHDSFDIAGLQYYMATSLIQLKEFDKARKKLDSALVFATHNKFIQGLQSCYEAYSRLDSLEGNYLSAFRNYKRYIFYKDSLTNEEKNIKIAQQVLQYEYEKKSLSEKLIATNTQQKLKFQKYLLLVAILGVVVIAWLIIYHYKQKQLAKSALALEQSRTRISRDLHDELGSNLSSISMQASVAKRKLMRQEDAIDIVEHISTSSQEMVSKMSDIVWSLLSENENATQLIERITNYCAITLPDHDINFEVTNNLGDSEINIHTETLKELYLIIKEAVHNSLKHSNCKKVNIDFTQDPHKVSVRISDDGNGFKIDKPARTTGGNGLKNMRQRAEKIGAQYKIISNQENGTSISLEIDLSHLSHRST